MRRAHLSPSDSPITRSIAAVLSATILLLGLWLSPAVPAAAATVTVPITHDATVRQATPTSTSGSATTLSVDGSPVQHTLMRFTVTGTAPNTITRATLRLYITNSSAVGGSVRQTTTSWSESSVTWNTAPSGGAVVGSIGPVTSGRWVDVDLGPLVTGDGTFAVRIDSSSTDGADYRSSEASSNRPTVVLTTADGTQPPEPAPTPTPTPTPLTAAATVETVNFPTGTGDIADDSAVYTDTASPGRSVVIADSKHSTSGGIAVFSMTGSLLQFRQDGRIGNVDLRRGFRLGDRDVVLVGANNRTNNTLLFWTYDPASQRLSAPVNAGPIATHASNYGFCLYVSPSTGGTYAFVTQSGGSGSVQQFELSGSTGVVEAQLVRTFSTGSQTEGCVADDELAQLYVGEEDVAVWRYGAEPSAGSTRTAVDTVGARLVADIEGLSIAARPGGEGYLVVSSQGDSSIALYERRPGNAFVRRLSVVGSGSVDSVTGTDGLDVSTASAGPGFTSGVLVVHDETNTGGTTSNLKYVPLDRVLPSG